MIISTVLLQPVHFPWPNTITIIFILTNVFMSFIYIFMAVFWKAWITKLHHFQFKIMKGQIKFGWCYVIFVRHQIKFIRYQMRRAKFQNTAEVKSRMQIMVPNVVFMKSNSQFSKESNPLGKVLKHNLEWGRQFTCQTIDNLKCMFWFVCLQNTDPGWHHHRQIQ